MGKKENCVIQFRRKLRGKAPVLLAAGLIMAAAVWGYLREDYRIYGQFSFGGGEYRETVMNVIVRLGAGSDEVAEQIIEEYKRVNYDNISDRITLRLYHSKWALERGNYYKEYVRYTT